MSESQRSHAAAAAATDAPSVKPKNKPRPRKRVREIAPAQPGFDPSYAAPKPAAKRPAKRQRLSRTQQLNAVERAEHVSRRAERDLAAQLARLDAHLKFADTCRVRADVAERIQKISKQVDSARNSLIKAERTDNLAAETHATRTACMWLLRAVKAQSATEPHHQEMTQHMAADLKDVRECVTGIQDQLLAEIRSLKLLLTNSGALTTGCGHMLYAMPRAHE